MSFDACLYYVVVWILVTERGLALKKAWLL